MSRPGFPAWWDTTVTIYNKYVDPQTQVITWFKNVVTDCFWRLQGSTVKVGDVTLDSKAIICRIPKCDNYMDKQDWVELPNDEMSEYFTLGQGDIIVKGICDEIIDENTRGHRSTDLLNKYKQYQAVMEITEYVNNTGVARNNEHYFVRGK